MWEELKGGFGVMLNGDKRDVLNGAMEVGLRAEAKC